jgi:hypothetical protein
MIVVREMHVAAFATGILFAVLLGACDDSPGEDLSLLGPIEVGTSAPYRSMMEPGSNNEMLAARYGYVEEEYFLSGTANLYEYSDSGDIAVETPRVAYTTRLMVMRPRDRERASGIVYLFPFHPLRGMNFWESVRDYVMRGGHTYVGALIGTDERSRLQSEQGNVLDALGVLQEWSAERYSAIDWPRDDGIRWDVFGQVAQLLRSESANNPLVDAPVNRVYAVGWSFTGSFLRTFINEGFHERFRRESGAPVIDGYLVGISNYHYVSGYVPINSESAVPAFDDPRRNPKPIDVPVIELMTENEAVTKSGLPPIEADHGIGRHRVYEVPGVTHGDGLRDAYPPDDCPFEHSDVPFRQIAWGALAALDDWVEGDAIPPKAAPIQVDFDSDTAVLDAYGTAMGGVRPAEIAVPLAYYGAPDEPSCDGGGRPYMVMRRIPFSSETLAELYPGGREQYLRQYADYLDEQIEERWILPEDRQVLLDNAARAARFDD